MHERVHVCMCACVHACMHACVHVCTMAIATRTMAIATCTMAIAIRTMAIATRIDHGDRKVPHGDRHTHHGDRRMHHGDRHTHQAIATAPVVWLLNTYVLQLTVFKFVRQPFLRMRHVVRKLLSAFSSSIREVLSSIKFQTIYSVSRRSVLSLANETFVALRGILKSMPGVVV